jgi:hypothetical protein
MSNLTDAPPAPAEQPAETYEFLPGETTEHFQARHDAIRSARDFSTGWYAAVEALIDATQGMSRTRSNAIWAALNKLDGKAAVDAYRARDYASRKRYADKRAAERAS